MTASAGDPAAGPAVRSAAVGPGPDPAVPGYARQAAWPEWIPLVPGLVSACVVTVGITSPSYWRDEAATLAAVQRPAGALLRMLGNVDAVHGPYYLLMWLVAQLLGTSELMMRLPSAIAMAMTAVVVTATGRRLVSPSVGLAAGLIFAVSPTVSEFGQMARSYAMVTLAAAIASYILVRALQEDGGRARWIGYGAALTVLGALNIFALLLIPAHAVTVLVRYRGRGHGGVRRPVLLRWLVAAGAAVIINAPLIDLADHQRGQIFWLTRPGLGGVGNAIDLLGPPWMTLAILATVLIAGVARLARGRAARASGRADVALAQTGATSAQTGATSASADDRWGGISALCVPWLVLPPAVLLSVTALVSPVYTDRYILFCLPAAALVVGACLVEIARIPRHRLAGMLASQAAFLLVAGLGLGLQVQYRQADGHADNIRAIDAIVASHEQPGDVMIYSWPVFMPISAAYPYGLATVPDAMVKVPAIPSGTLAGTTVSTEALRQRLAHVRRLWIVTVSTKKSEQKLLSGLDLRLVRTWQTSDIWLSLYAREPPPSHAREHARRPQHAQSLRSSLAGLLS